MRLAVIGGTALTRLDGFEIGSRCTAKTPYGEASAELVTGVLHGAETVFLCRHGENQAIPPHRINYRANIWALKNAGIKAILAAACVGGIRSDMAPGTIAVPDQLIDYTYGRRNTFFEGELDRVVHIDFTRPYSPGLRQKILEAAADAGVPVVADGTYGCTQGPRLETAAEIVRMERDGCDLVGMTGMPEAALARELEMDYACCAVVANWAAGKSDGSISMADIERNVESATEKLDRLLRALLQSI